MRRIKIIGSNNLSFVGKYSLKFEGVNLTGALRIFIYDNSNGRLLFSGNVPVIAEILATNVRINILYEGNNYFQEVIVYLMTPDFSPGRYITTFFSGNIPSFEVNNNYLFEYIFTF
jgi:hypothetical protein